MACVSQSNHVAKDSPSPKGGFAVQPFEDTDRLPIDGPILDDNTAPPSPAVSNPNQKNPSRPTTPPDSDSDYSHISKPTCPASSFHTAKKSIGSDTTLDDGEVREDIVKDFKTLECKSSTKEGEVTENDNDTGEADICSEAEADNTARDESDQTKVVDENVNASKIEALLAKARPGVAVTNTTAVYIPVQAETLKGAGRSEAATQQAEDIAITDSKETEADSRPVQLMRSASPHMRNSIESLIFGQAAPQVPKYPNGKLGASRYVDLPRAPRFQGRQNDLTNYNTGGGPAESARLGALLMKARNELEEQRKANANLRKSIGEETQKVTDEALSASTLELLNKQIKTLAYQAKLEAKERELQFREDRIEQIEVFLSEGQKYIHRQTNGEEGMSMAEVVSEHESRQAELIPKKNIADREAKLSMHFQSLQIHEAAQQMREQQYKALVRGSLEAELRARFMPDMKVKLEEVAELEFNRGYGEGKAAGRKEADIGIRQKGFFEGYDACHRAQAALRSVRAGRIPCDSPELDFLYDASHPHNAYNVGSRSGGVVLSTLKVNGTGGQQKAAPVAVRTVHEQVEVEESVCKLRPPPPRATFASELRGTQTMHNGHHVLANSSSSSSPAPTPRTNGMNGTTGVKGAVKSDAEGNDVTDVYVGRCVVQYEEVEKSNLIDLH